MVLILWDINNLSTDVMLLALFWHTFQYTHVAIGEIMDIVSELGKGVLLDLYEKYHICACGLGWCSQYSNSLRTVQSGDWIPVMARCSTPIQTGCGSNPDSFTLHTGSFPGVKQLWNGINLMSPFSAKFKESGIPLLPHPYLYCRV